jgi:hypothetical protein
MGIVKNLYILGNETSLEILTKHQDLHLNFDGFINKNLLTWKLTIDIVKSNSTIRN